MSRPDFLIETWDEDHPRWAELWALIEAQGQAEWCQFKAGWHKGSTMLAALAGGEVSGFLRFVVQDIGVEEDHEVVTLNGNPLTEAKILAFGVAEQWRGQGAGRALQHAAAQAAQAQGCYQLRSFSGGKYETNHHLKLSMGFAVQPVVRGDDTRGVYFILPLKAKPGLMPE